MYLDDGLTGDSLRLIRFGGSGGRVLSDWPRNISPDGMDVVPFFMVMGCELSLQSASLVLSVATDSRSSTRDGCD